MIVRSWIASFQSWLSWGKQLRRRPIGAAARRSSPPVCSRGGLSLEVLEDRLAPTVAINPGMVALAGPVTAGLYNGVVDDFTETGRTARASDFTAFINWGDHSPFSVGTVQPDGNGGFNVLGSHTYQEGLDFPTVTIVDTVANVTATANSQSWTYTGLAVMPTPRAELAAVAGSDGRIYAIGGNNGGSALNTVEAYDPASNTWTTAASLPTARSDLAAVAGPDGRIYAIGGASNGSYLNTVEAYDPASNTWTTAAPMSTARAALAAVAVPDGRIFAIGGDNYGALNTVEAYDPASNTWTTAASLPTACYLLAATVGSDGRIYALGGFTGSSALNTVEVYNPATNTWTTAAPLPTACYGLGAAAGPDGRIYALFGLDNTGSALNTVEAYDPATNTSTTAYSLLTARYTLAAAADPDGRIYAIGGRYFSILNTVEALTFQPVHVLHGALTAGPINLSLTVGAPFTGAVVHFTSTNTLETAGDFTALIHWGDGTPDSVGTVTGGSGHFTVSSSHFYEQVGTEALQVVITDSAGVQVTAGGTPTWTTAASLPTARDGLAAVAGPDGSIYTIGGANNSGDLNTVEMYDPATNAWTTATSLPTARAFLAAVAGPDGRIYALGGEIGSGSVNEVEVYDPASNTWTTTASLPTARDGLAAVVGPDGRIYALGGYDTGALNTVEAYDPASNTWTTVASLPTARYGLAAVAGPDGRIYTIGGANNSGDLNTVEVYDPATNTWTTAAPLPTARDDLAAVVGPDGRIYAIGGFSGGSALNTVEAYDPATNTWTPAASLPTPSFGLGTVAGPDGRIYAIGGFNNSYLNAVEALSYGSGAAVTPLPPALISPYSGNNQRGTIHAAYGTNLAVLVTDSNGQPVSRIPITFSASLSSPGGSFNGGSAAIATTNAAGIAVAPVAFTADGNTGSVTITASAGALNTMFTLTNVNANQGGTFTVTSLGDSDPTGGGLGSGSSGDLRYVLNQADNAGGNDTIQFAPGLSGTIVVQSQVLPAIATNLALTGPGANVVTVNGNSLGSVFTIDHNETVSLSGLTLTGGTGTNFFGLIQGGGIDNLGTLTVSNCILSACSAQFGGGIINDGILTVSNSTLSACSATNGGGIFNNGYTVTVSNSTFSTCSASNGGGIESFGGTLTVSNSTFSACSAGNGGGIFDNGGTVTVSNSTLSACSASYGGGISDGSGTLMVSNSTLSANSATVAGGGISNRIGGTLTVSNSTLSANIVSGTGSQGGGISNDDASGSTSTLHDTIVAGNSATGGATDPDFSGTVSPSVTIGNVTYTEGYNLIGDGTGSSGFTTGDQVGTSASPLNAQLGPLQNNGGSTQTMALLGNSPAINAGDPNTAGLPENDQRGPSFSRQIGIHPDIGAYEYQTVVYGPAAALAASAGDSQSAVVSKAFPIRLAVQVTDVYHNPQAVSGLKVTFTIVPNGTVGGAFGTATTATALTNAQGLATAPALKANTHAGSFTVTATAAGFTKATFHLTNMLTGAAPIHATALAGPPAELSSVAGQSQNARLRQAFAHHLQALVVDSAGTPVRGATVTFTVLPNADGAGGSFSGNRATVTVKTSANGHARAPVLRANAIAGTFTVKASLVVAGVELEALFTLTNL